MQSDSLKITFEMANALHFQINSPSTNYQITESINSTKTQSTPDFFLHYLPSLSSPISQVLRLVI